MLFKLKIKIEDYCVGGMDVFVKLDMGMEVMEVLFLFVMLLMVVFKLFGLVD